MQVKLRVSRAGDGFSQQPGDVIDVTAEEAERMIAADQCVAVDDAGDGPETPKPSKPKPKPKPKPE